MHRLPIIAALLLLLPISALAASANPADLPAGHWTLDPKHASVIARVRHLGVSNYTLRFDKLEASFTYDPAHPEATKLEAGVDTTSLDVGADYSTKFADQFLDAAKFPKATFVSTAITLEPDGRSGTMTGDLTLRGVTLPMTLKVAFVAVGRSFPFGAVAGFSATGSLKRSDFGSRSLLSYVGDDVSLEIESEFDHK
jgi:polyisoprenoid-binding protein YceI